MNNLDEIIFEIGDMIRVRYKSKFLIFGRIPLTAKEIINTHEFKMEFQQRFPKVCELVLSEFYKNEKSTENLNHTDIAA